MILARIAVVLLVLVGAAARAETVVLRAGDGSVGVGLALDLLLTDRADLTPDQALAAPGWQRSTSAAPNFGLTTRTAWARFQVRREADVQTLWYIVIAHGMQEHVALFTGGPGRWQVSQGGSAVPPAARPVSHRHAVLPLDVPAGAPTEVLLRISTRGSITLPISLRTPMALAAHDHYAQLMIGIILGVAVAVAIYTLLLFVVVGDRAHLWLAALVAAYASFQANQMGLLRNLTLFDEAWPGQHVSAILAPLSAAAGVAFFASFFRIDQVQPRLTRISRHGARILLALSFLLLVLGGPAPAHWFNVALSLAAFVFALTLIILFGRRDRRAMVFVVVGMLLFLAGLPTFLLRMIGVIGFSDWQALVHESGFALGAVVFAAALTDRLRLDREMQAAALRVSEQSLEAQVALRTGELARTVEQLAAAKLDAETANRAKSAFLAHMSHELRTPLNAVIGFSEIIRDRLFGDDAGRYREYAADIHASGQHLLTVVNDVLDLSKIEAGRLDLMPEPVDVHVLLNECRVMVAPLADKGGLLVHLPEPAGDGALFADRAAVKQILLNLLSNAVKFTPPAGRVDVAVERLATSLRVTVTDTGIGIPPEALLRVFEPFQRGDAQTSRDKPGTGLGLAISRRLARLHGGELTLSSALGRGTTALLVLPLDQSGVERL